LQTDLEGKIALITGGGMGIGRSTALAFAREGARVVVADMSPEDAEETARTIKRAGGEAISVRADVSRAADVEAMVQRAVEVYGRLDCAYNNAGTEGAGGSTVDSTEENWDRVIGTNLKGVWLCMKYEIPQMLKQGKGAIVNTASIAGVGGVPNNSVYGASKAGVAHLTRTAALEYASSGIRVNAVCPGFTRTSMLDRIKKSRYRTQEELDALHPMGRVAEPTDIAGAVIWLCSDAASFVTGHSLFVDGGYSAK